MKVYAISDLHLSGNNPKPMDIFGGAWADYMQKITEDWLSKVTDEDIVLISGDISWAMNLGDAVPDLKTICDLPGKKIIIRGNHDYWWKSIGAVRSALYNGGYAVQNDCVKIGNVIICGSRGWATPENSAPMAADDKKIYDREVLRFTLSLDAMQKLRGEDDKVIAMIHYPPFNSRFESSAFTRLFEQYKIDAVVYGHLHGPGGRLCFKQEKEGVKYYLTSCDLVRNRLVEIEL